MKKLNFLWMLSLLLIMGCAKEDVQFANNDQVLEARNGQGERVPRPFKAKVKVPVNRLSEGEFVGFCDGQFGNFNIVDDNPGQTNTKISHLGRISVAYSEACVRPYLQEDTDVFPLEIYGPFLPALSAFPIPGITTQEDIITAANGKDQLFIKSTFESSPNPDDKFNSLLNGTFEITGGTGKFEGASGGGKLTGSASANFLAPIYPYIRIYDGEITY